MFDILKKYEATTNQKQTINPQKKKTQKKENKNEINKRKSSSPQKKKKGTKKKQNQLEIKVKMTINTHIPTITLTNCSWTERSSPKTQSSRVEKNTKSLQYAACKRPTLGQRTHID